MYDPAHGPGLPEPKKKRMSNYVRPSDSKYMSGHESSSPARHHATPTSGHGHALGKSPRFGASPSSGHNHPRGMQQKVKSSHLGATPSVGVASYDSAGSGGDDLEPNFSGVGGVTGKAPADVGLRGREEGGLWGGVGRLEHAHGIASPASPRRPWGSTAGPGSPP